MSSNTIIIFLGWDKFGLVSYCLVTYYQNMKSHNTEILTALSNRIGCIIILIVISWILNYGISIYTFYINIIVNDYSINFAGVIIVLADIIKIAQIPFRSWLSAAIAANTPYYMF